MNRAACILCLVACGCGGNSEDRSRTVPATSAPRAEDRPTTVDPVRKFRLFESEEQRETTSKAVTLANKVLGPDVPFRLRPSWEAGGPAGPETVRVYLVDTDPPGKYGLSFVPRGERCVFVDAKRVAAIADIFSKNFKGAIALPVDQLLAVTLLHEAGHIFHGHWGGMNNGEGSGDLDLNLEENDGKRRESEADRFAADQIKAGMQVGTEAGRFATALKLGTTATTMSVNFTLQRLMDDFGATSLRLPHAYWDDGYSHPNLVYRVLKINYEISPTDAGQKLIDDFEESRKARRQESERKKK